MTIEKLKEKLAKVKESSEKVLANLNAHNGAIEVLNDLIREMESEENKSLDIE